MSSNTRSKNIYKCYLLLLTECHGEQAIFVMTMESVSEMNHNLVTFCIETNCLHIKIVCLDKSYPIPLFVCTL